MDDHLTPLGLALKRGIIVAANWMTVEDYLPIQALCVCIISFIFFLGVF